MAEAIVGPLLSKLQEVALTEAKALAGVSGEIDRLRDKLMWLHAFVDETDLRSRHNGNQLLRVLASQMREVAFEAEDAIDQFSSQVDLSRLFGRDRWRATIKFLANIRTQISVRYTLSRKIKSMSARLEDIVQNSAMYNMEHGSSEHGMAWRACSTIPLIRQNWENSVPFKLKCRKKEKQALETKLTNCSGRTVIYVVGDGGIGKRALLKHAYENAAITEHFHIRIWVSFPADTTAKSMVHQIKEKLMHERSLHSATRDRDMKEVRFLVVIDSLVSTTKWAKVEEDLLGMCGHSVGSKILLTATSWHDDNKDNIIKLGHLDKSDSVTLFNYFVLGPKGSRKSEWKTHQMDMIRWNIEEITNGLPLAVVLLAKLMRTKEYNKWGTAYQRIKDNEKDNVLKTIVSLSICDLPKNLKSCLLYTAGFPEKRAIDAQQLVRLWMAEGFLITQEHREMEQLGQRYLAELIYRGLLQPVDRTIHSVKSIAIHEHVHPLFRLEAERTGFMDVHFGGHVPAPNNTRRLALVNYNDRLRTLSKRLSKLRTVVSYYKEDDPKAGSEDVSATKEPVCKMQDMLKGSPFLRVINLEGLDIGPKLPSEIGDMVHLEYLGVRCRSLKKVPRSIGNLRKLHTIDVRGTLVMNLPHRVWKIKSLRHVFGDNLLFPRSPGDLKLMQTLETVRIDHMDDCSHATAAREVSLSGPHLLRRLHVVGLDVNQTGPLQALLDDFSFLESLALSGDVIPMGFCTSGAPLEHVVSLELDGKLQPDNASSASCNCNNNILFQGFRSFFLNITRLVLKSTQVNQDFINVISTLPALTELVLLTGSYQHHELVLCSSGFSRLEVLQLCDLISLEKIVVPDNATRQKHIHHAIIGMPNLKIEIHKVMHFKEAAPSGLYLNSPTNITTRLGATAKQMKPRTRERNTKGVAVRRSIRLAEKRLRAQSA